MIFAAENVTDLHGFRLPQQPIVLDHVSGKLRTLSVKVDGASTVEDSRALMDGPAFITLSDPSQLG